MRCRTVAACGLLAATLLTCGPDARRTTTEWSAACPLELETHADEPVHDWVSCETETGLAGCRRLATPGVVTPTPRIHRSGSGALEIAYGQRLEASGGAPARKQWQWSGLEGDLRLRAVQEDSDTAPCTYYVETLDDDALRLGVRGDGRLPLADSLADGLLELDRSGRARVLFRNDDHEVSRWNGSLRRVAPDRRLERHALGEAEGDPVDVIHDPAGDPDRLGIGAAAPIEASGHVYFEVGDAKRRAILSWSEETGSRPLRRHADDAHRVAGNLGSDGDVLVWTEAEAPDDDGRFARSWVVVAPVASPDQARPVAPDSAPAVGAAPFAVGCGLAGHRTPEGALVVDLASGATRLLQSSSGLRWGNVVAVSCDEIFVAYARAQAGARAGGRGMELARIPHSRGDASDL
jgi:hypothetical protein